jgi:DNA-binding HxlR family transcriptional regulator
MDSEDTQSETGGLEKPDGLDAYLSKKGTVELFSVLTISGKRFSELESLVGISPATLSDRLEEGLELHLLKLDSEPEDDRQTQRYYATGYGKEIDREAAVRHLQSLHNARRDFESDREALLDSVDDAD